MRNLNAVGLVCSMVARSLRTRLADGLDELFSLEFAKKGGGGGWVDARTTPVVTGVFRSRTSRSTDENTAH
jgi:hypothetical protein